MHCQGLVLLWCRASRPGREKHLLEKPVLLFFAPLPPAMCRDPPENAQGISLEQRLPRQH